MSIRLDPKLRRLFNKYLGLPVMPRAGEGNLVTNGLVGKAALVLNSDVVTPATLNWEQIPVCSSCDRAYGVYHDGYIGASFQHSIGGVMYGRGVSKQATFAGSRFTTLLEAVAVNGADQVTVGIRTPSGDTTVIPAANPTAGWYAIAKGVFCVRYSKGIPYNTGQFLQIATWAAPGAHAFASNMGYFAANSDFCSTLILKWNNVNAGNQIACRLFVVERL